MIPSRVHNSFWTPKWKPDNCGTDGLGYWWAPIRHWGLDELLRASMERKGHKLDQKEIMQLYPNIQRVCFILFYPAGWGHKSQRAVKDNGPKSFTSKQCILFQQSFCKRKKNKWMDWAKLDRKFYHPAGNGGPTHLCTKLSFWYHFQLNCRKHERGKTG